MMIRYSSVAVSLLALCLQLSDADARTNHANARIDWNTCAFDAQQAVARRHGLRGQDSGAVGSIIYSDPRLSQEADDAFDACVKKQSGVRRPRA